MYIFIIIIRYWFHWECVFILHVHLGTPIFLRFLNTSDKGFRIGDRVDLNVAFKGNPAAEVSWIFNSWNSNRSQNVPADRIQKQSVYHTAVVIKSLNTNDFGTYKLRLKNIHGSIIKDFKIQGIFLSFNFLLFFFLSLKIFVSLSVNLISF